MSPAWRNRGIGLALAAVIYVVDQWIKRMVDGPWGLVNEGASIYLLPFFNLTRVHNYGVSLGYFKATSVETRWALVGVTALIASVVFVWQKPLHRLNLWNAAKEVGETKEGFNSCGAASGDVPKHFPCDWL